MNQQEFNALSPLGQEETMQNDSLSASAQFNSSVTFTRLDGQKLIYGNNRIDQFDPKSSAFLGKTKKVTPLEFANILASFIGGE